MKAFFFKYKTLFEKTFAVAFLLIVSVMASPWLKTSIKDFYNYIFKDHKIVNGSVLEVRESSSWNGTAYFATMNYTVGNNQYTLSEVLGDSDYANMTLSTQVKIRYRDEEPYRGTAKTKHTLILSFVLALCIAFMFILSMREFIIELRKVVKH